MEESTVFPDFESPDFPVQPRVELWNRGTIDQPLAITHVSPLPHNFPLTRRPAYWRISAVGGPITCKSCRRFLGLPVYAYPDIPRRVHQIVQNLWWRAG